MKDWHLFLDESGDFGSGDDPGDARVCVAGLLVQEGNHRDLALALREAFEAVAPHVPYPMHATDLRLPSGHLDGWLRTEAARRSRHWAGVALDATEVAVRGAIERRNLPGLRALVAGAASGSRVRREVLVTANAELVRELPPHHEALRRLGRDVDGLVTLVLGELVRGLGPDRCHVLAAADDLAEWPEGLPPGDRYLRTLTVLFERIYALLRGGADLHRVVVWPAGRDIDYGSLGRAPLTQLAVRRCLADAARFPLACPKYASQDGLQVSVGAPARYNAAVDPGIVVADWLANRLRHCLGASSWGTLRTSFAREVPIPIEAAPRVCATAVLPAMAGDGAPAEAIRLAFRSIGGAGGQIPPVVQSDRTWSGDQAQRWVDLAGRLV